MDNIVKYYVYNRIIAKEHGIDKKKTFKYYAWLSILGIFVVVLSFILDFKFYSVIDLPLRIIGFFIIIAANICVIINIRSMNYGNIAYAVSDTGRIYYLLLFQTNSRGYKVRHRFGNVDVSELYHSLGNENTFDEALDYLKEPEIINTMIREAENGINGGEVFEIKDVYKITEYKDHYLIECDYIIMRKNRIYDFNLIKDQIITVGKAYEGYEELIEYFKTHIKTSLTN